MVVERRPAEEGLNLERGTKRKLVAVTMKGGGPGGGGGGGGGGGWDVG